MTMNWLRGLRGDQAGKDEERASATPATASPAEPDRPAPALADPPEAWAEAVCHATDKVLAAEWLAHVEDQSLLAGIAIRCRFAEVRLAAVRRIADPAVLKRVADASSDKDKHVYRHCTESLKAHRQENKRARRAVDFTLALHALLDVTPVAISHLLQIEKDLAALGVGGEETAECEALLEQARARVLLETQAQIDLRALLTEAEALRAWMAAAETAEASDIDVWRARSEEIAHLAATGPAWLATLPAARALARTLEDIDAVLLAGAEAIERAAAEAVQRAEQEASERRAADEAQAALSAAAAAARKPPRKTVDLEAVLTQVAALEQHLEEGRTAEAESSLKQIEHALGKSKPTAQIVRRLQRARAQLARLAGWARWGTDQAREQLIGEAEALLRGEPDIDERARAVPLLRREWKNLDVHGGAAQSAWKRFDRALEKAYKPVAELRAVEAAAHAAARAVREALCEAGEAWLTGQADAAADFKALAAKREEMIAAWRSAPKAGFRDERQLRKRFDSLLVRIDAPLEAARAQELARRQALVTDAQALLEEADLGRALSAAKTLQRRWKDEATAVHLKQGAEQKLWQRFRKACDAVFARRDIEQAAQIAERTERDQARQAELQAARAIETQKKAQHAARFAQMAEKAASVLETNPDANSDALARGHAERGAQLLELEIALDLPTPEAHVAERRARMLARLQDRFRIGTRAPDDPEVLVKKWYAIVATQDDVQTARMAVIVQCLLDRPAAAPARSAPSHSRPSRHDGHGNHNQGRKVSRS